MRTGSKRYPRVEFSPGIDDLNIYSYVVNETRKSLLFLPIGTSSPRGKFNLFSVRVGPQPPVRGHHRSRRRNFSAGTYTHFAYTRRQRCPRDTGTPIPHTHTHNGLVIFLFSLSFVIPPVSQYRRIVISFIFSVIPGVISSYPHRVITYLVRV